MKLSERLRAVAELVPPGSRVADIGAGHGLLPLWLLTGSRISHCVATEKTREAGAELSRLPAVPGLEVRFGDGLQALRRGDRLDVLILSGLGARTMLGILESDPETISGVSRLVLQPQTEASRLRRWLAHNGRSIVAERMVRDRGRFYTIVAAVPGRAGLRAHASLDPEDLLEAGPCLVSCAEPVVRAYWRQTLRRLERILEHTPATAQRGRRARRHRDLAARILRAIDG